MSSEIMTNTMLSRQGSRLWRRVEASLIAQDKQVDRFDNGFATVRSGGVASHCRKPSVKLLLAQFCEDRIASSGELLRVDRPVRGDGLRDDLCRNHMKPHSGEAVAYLGD